MDATVIYGKRLRQLMEEYGINQTELSDRLYLTAGAISLYVLGKRAPRVDTIIELAEFFDVSLDYMFGLSDFRKPVNQAIYNVPVLKSYVNGENNFDDSNVEYYKPVVKACYNDLTNLFGFSANGMTYLIEKTKEVKTGDLVLFSFDRSGSSIYSLTTTTSGWLLDNGTPMFVSWDEIDAKNIRVVGRVVESIKKF